MSLHETSMGAKITKNEYKYAQELYFRLEEIIAGIH